MGETADARASYHHGDLRQALLDASVQLIAEGGVQALSLRGAARKAGVSSGAPYHHFKNRTELLNSIATEGFALLAQAMDRLLEDASDPAEKLSCCGIAYVEFARAHPAHYKVMFRPELARPSEEGPSPGEEVFRRLVASVIEAQEAGVAPSGDPEKLVLTSWSVAHGLASLMVDGPLGCHFDKIAMPLDEMARTVMKTYSDALRRAAESE